MTNDERDTIIVRTHDTVIRLEETLKHHTANNIIHQVPPCEPHRTLIARLWCLAVLGIGSLCTALVALFK
jgi:hypothetical protein